MLSETHEGPSDAARRGLGRPGSARLADLSPPQRLAIGLFLLLVVGFYALAQAKLLVEGGSSGYPGPASILRKYHGDRTKSRLHVVLDPKLAFEDPLAMWPHLGKTEEDVAARRKRLLDWVEAGSPRAEWPAVAPLFQGELRTPEEAGCGVCHVDTSASGGHPREERAVSFDSYERVVAAVRADTGMSANDLATSSHNHLMGFAVVSLLVSLAYSFTRWRGLWLRVPIVLAFAGSAIDVASWWLTRAHGAPWHYGVMLGGGLFGSSVLWMVVLSLDELWLRGSIGSLVERLGRPLGAAREPSRTEP